jgi:hypothetical protein
MKLIHTFEGKLPLNFRMDSANKAALNKYEQNKHGYQQNNYTFTGPIGMNLHFFQLFFQSFFHFQMRKTQLIRQSEANNVASRPAKIPVMLRFVGQQGTNLATLVRYDNITFYLKLQS